MSTIVEATVPAEQFALSGAMDSPADPTFDVVRVVENDAECPFPFVWGQSEDVEEMLAALDADPSVTAVRALARFGDEVLLETRLAPRSRILTYVVHEEEGTILDAHGADGVWSLRILFPDRDSTSRTRSFCDENGLDLVVQRIRPASDPLRAEEHELTDDQHEILRLAYESGFYEVPRETTLEELAAAVGVSHQAISERLRRAHRTLIAQALLPDEAPVQPHWTGHSRAVGASQD